MEASQTVATLLSSKRFSRTVSDTLRRALPSSFAEAPTVDVSSYLESALRAGAESGRTDANAVLFRALTQILGGERVQEVLRPASPSPRNADVAVSKGLLAAVEDAVEIRERTGGRDAFTGARYVLVAILTSQDASVRRELAAARSLVGEVDTGRLLLPLAALIRSALERPNEKLAVWREILLTRGFDEAAESLRDVPLPHVQRDAVARFRNDDPQSLGREDIVGTDRVATALARVTASEQFEPPLAVGIFGRWGSGKSLLMRRVREEVDRLDEESRSGRQPQTGGSGGDDGRIVQITFNAWHYVDTDLWANLVGRIFEELDRHDRTMPVQPGDGLLDQLTTARELSLSAAKALVDRRLAAHQAREALRSAEDALAGRRATLAERLRGLARAGAEARDADAAIAATYGRTVEEMAAIWSGPREAAEALQRDGLVWLEFRRRLGTWQTLLLGGVAVLACLAAPLLGSAMADLSPRIAGWIAQVSPGALALSGLLATVSGRVAVVTRAAVRARDAAVAAVAGYRAELREARPGSDLSAGRIDLERAEGQVEQARRSLAEAVELQATAAASFAAQTPAERLRSFVRLRAAADGPYRSREGLIGTIRRDFADLTALLRSTSETTVDDAASASARSYKLQVEKLNGTFEGALTEAELRELTPPDPKDVPRSFRRIVLHIDDLDRCAADKVVEVLQAVHMLLAFSLFVVFVAVDVRWLEGALEDRYRQLGQGREPHAQGHAAALDYLEKIFQLAVWTEPIVHGDVKALVRKRLVVASESRPVPITLVPPIEPPPDDESRPVVGPERATESSIAQPTSALLEVTEGEAGFLELIAATLDLSPRRLLRLINSYQVARASLPMEDARELLKGGFKGLIAALAASAAAPSQFAVLTQAIQAASNWEDLVTRMGEERASDPYGAWIARLGDEGVKVTDVRAHLPLAQRFSFSGSPSA